MRRNLFAIINLDLEHLSNAQDVLVLFYSSALPETKQRELTKGGSLFRMRNRPNQQKNTE